MMSRADWDDPDEFTAMMAEWKRRAAERRARALICHRMTSTAYRYRLRRSDQADEPHALIGSTRAQIEDLIRACGHEHLTEAAMAVLDLHAPDEEGECGGCCNPDGGVAYLWPCPTTLFLLTQVPGGGSVEMHAAELRTEPW
ncbi:hypothetical protein AB0I72_19090 [Nocardiopsis sp. NPDC049922]|uniref:hypothetical protein n=1 Tax=Nocardiopsis sp. NPDC049922 TaxID=3155157 RepID=UPI0033FD163B